VSIGEGASVHDCATVTGRRGSPVTIGRDAVVSAGAIVEGATLSEGCMIGMGARVLAGAHIGKDAFVDGGAVVPPGTRVEAGTLWTGNPASELRRLSEEEMSVMRSEAAAQAELAAAHFEQGLVNEDVEAFEDQQHDYEWKVAHYMDPAAPLPGPVEDVQHYYKLSQPAPDTGLFREQDYLDDQVIKGREAAENDADAAEDAYYAALGSLSRVSVAIQELSTMRAERADLATELTQVLAEEDPRAHAYLRDLAHRAVAAESEEDTLAVMGEVAALDPFRRPASFELEDEVAALKKHAPAVIAAPVDEGAIALPTEEREDDAGPPEEAEAARLEAEAAIRNAHAEAVSRA